MDIEKAFDHVPRSLLLRKLVSLGVGKCMLFALKQVYSFSICVLKLQDDLSGSFSMNRGVRQGAASSVLLFNAFIDGLFDHLDSKCEGDELLSNLHALIHADDTIILSTNREQFIHKCNQTIAFFTENKLRLNMGKSCYLIINSNSTVHTRSNIILESGLLKYKNSFKYLGVIISDCGSVKQDVKSIIDRKRSNVSIKFTNFCKVNRNAPLDVKLKVLDICVVTSIIYASETWGNNSKEADVCYRSGLKTALSVRKNTNNEIIYVESGKFPLHCKVQKLQTKFWLYVLRYIADFPGSALSKVIEIGEISGISYVRYYKNLIIKFGDPVRCEQMLNQSFMATCKQKFIDASVDIDSKLGTYYHVNPLLKPFTAAQNLTENERILITRFRTGSHSLAVEIGRFSNVKRENRLCVCGDGVQTVWHIFTECQFTRTIVNKRFNNLSEIFQDENLLHLLLLITKKLKISTF